MTDSSRFDNPRLDMLDQLAERLALTLPPGIKALRRDVEDNFRTVLHANLERLDLVSREAFETQADLLAETQKKLKALEARLADIEERQRASKD